MSTPQFLDADGLNKYHKEVVEKKVDRIIGKGLSTNDLTNKLKNNYDSAYSHSLAAHAPADAEKNQNAFVKICIGDSSLEAETPAAALNIKGEGNISVSITEISPHKYITFNTVGFAAVATSGSYNDLSNKPAIPSIEGLVAEQDLAAVATSGSYNDLSDKPAIPTKTSQLTNDSNYITGYTETDPTVPTWAKASSKPTYTYNEITEKPTLATVATSGSYSDLTNRPTIPTKTSDLTNDSGFTANTGTVTQVTIGSTEYNPISGIIRLPEYPSIPTKVSELTNDKNYITSYTETDPTVPAWAKAATKPSYTAAEVGALPSNTSIPSKLSDLESDDTHQTVTAAEKTKWNSSGAVNLPPLPETATSNQTYTLKAKIQEGVATPIYWWELDILPKLAAPEIHIEPAEK